MTAAQASGTAVQGTIDLGAYVDVGDQQGISVEEIDFIWQRAALYSSDVEGMVAGNGSLDAQLTDLNPGTNLVRADDNSLIASGSLCIDQANNIATTGSDFYPDTFGKLDESRMVVNDSLYLVGQNAGTAIGANDVYLTVRIKARIVKLAAKDWMAIAIQSTASDN